jgi:hypothetical protein
MEDEIITFSLLLKRYALPRKKFPSAKNRKQNFENISFDTKTPPKMFLIVTERLTTME